MLASRGRPGAPAAGHAARGAAPATQPGDGRALHRSKAKRIVAGWAGADGAAAPEPSGGLADLLRSRPARLGLGASAAQTRPGGADEDDATDLASAKLKQSVGKQERREQREREERRADAAEAAAGGDGDDDDDDDDVGRSGAFQPRAALRAAPVATAPPASGPKRKRAKPAGAPAAGAGAAEPPPRGSGRDPKPAAAPPRGDGPRGAEAAPAPAAAGGKGKRSKTRSKQKNLRRDTRAEHLKPTYRTPGAADYVPPAPPAWKGFKAGEADAGE